MALGAETAGLELAYAIEADKRPALTYERNLPSTAVAKTTLSPRGLKSLLCALGLAKNSVDLVIAGPPCQGFSISNLRTRDDLNPSNHAWRLVLQVAKMLRPSAVIVENVGGMATYKNGAVIRHLEKAFGRLGYTTKAYTLDAANFGVPQHRRRIFVLALKTGRLPSAIGSTANKFVPVADAFSDLPSLSNGNVQDEMAYSRTFAASSAYAKSMRVARPTTARNCCTSKNTPIVIRRFASVPCGGNWQDIPSELFTTYSRPDNCHRWLYRRLSPHAPSVTISNFRKNMLVHPFEDRTLSVREAARLQGIPDHFVFTGNLQSQQQQVANAVPPNMAKSVVKLVLTALCARSRAHA